MQFSHEFIDIKVKHKSFVDKKCGLAVENSRSKNNLYLK